MGWLDALISGAFGIGDSFLQNRMPLSVSDKQAHQLNVDETMRQERRQEDFYNQYQSIGAQVRQMQDSGINPAVAAGGLQASSPASGPSYSGASASLSDGLSSVIPMLQALNVIKMDKAENARKQEAHEVGVRKTEAEIKNIESRTKGQDFSNEHAEEIFKLDKDEREARISHVFASIDEKEANSKLIRANTSLSELKSDYQRFMNSIAEVDAKTRESVIDSMLRSADAERLFIQSERELNELRKKYAEEDRPSQKRILAAQLEEAESQADYMKKRKEKNQQIVDAEVKALEGDARYSSHKFGLDLAGKISTGLGVLGGTALGAWKILSKGASKSFVPLATDLWIDSHNPATITGSILN